MSVLEVKNLTYTYNSNTPFYKDAVTDVSFSALENQIIGIIGHTGSGKSTLVQHLNGLLKATKGSVLFCGKDIWENPREIKKIRSQIGLVFQYPEYQLFADTVFEDIAFGPENMGIENDSVNETVLSAAAQVKIPEEYLKKSPFDLSGGEKRRVAIAGILAMKPKVIVFDEPTAGLDPKGREIIIKIIREYKENNNATILIVSHSMEDMAELADKILVMNKGRLEMFDTPKKVFENSELLIDIGLDVPLVKKITDALRKKGYALPADIITVDDAVKAITKLKGGDGID